MFLQRASIRQPSSIRTGDWGKTCRVHLAERDGSHTHWPPGGCFGAQVVVSSSRWSRSVGGGVAGAALRRQRVISASSEYADPRDLQRIPLGLRDRTTPAPSVYTRNGNTPGMQVRGRSQAGPTVGVRLQRTCAGNDRSSLRSRTTVAHWQRICAQPVPILTNTKRGETECVSI